MKKHTKITIGAIIVSVLLSSTCNQNINKQHKNNHFILEYQRSDSFFSEFNGGYSDLCYHKINYASQKNYAYFVSLYDGYKIWFKYVYYGIDTINTANLEIISACSGNTDVLSIDPAEPIIIRPEWFRYCDTICLRIVVSPVLY